MARPQKRHPVWTMYEMLTKELGVSHDDAVHRLFETAPGMPVDLIIQAEGDMARTLEELTGQPPEPYVNGGRPDARRLSKQIAEHARNGQQAEPESFNDAIRARAIGQSNGVTRELSAAEITGVKDQAEYDPANDPIRQRYADRYQR